MEIYYAIMFYIIGTFLGSFYNVVGYRLPKGESILFPGSHCPNCGHQLKAWELIPVFSFFLQRRKCTSCHQKISWFYPIFEFSCGVLFAIAYLVFGLNPILWIVLTFISMMIIIVLSDYYYMIIPDEVLIVCTLLLGIEVFIIYGFESLLSAVFSGVISFLIMFLLKKFGDALFERESMGGGDIKLMFVIGFVVGWRMAIVTIFIASFIGLPISLIMLARNKSHIVPFGPFLSAASLLIVLSKIDFNWILQLFTRGS